MGGRTLPVFVFWFLTAAGCMSSADAPVEDASVAETGLEGVRVRVLVVNDEYLPIRNADVYLLELAINATTNRMGDAFFDGVPPGTYTVHAEGRGFLPNRTRVTVESDSSPTARLWLRDRAPDLYLIDFRRAIGWCDAGVNTDPQAVPARCQDSPMTPPAAVQFPMETRFVWGFLEIQWSAQGPGAERMGFAARMVDGHAFADGSTELVAQGTSRLSLQIPAELVTDAMRDRGNRLEVEAFPGNHPSVAVAQPFEVFAQLVYFHPATQPDGVTTTS